MNGTLALDEDLTHLRQKDPTLVAEEMTAVDIVKTGVSMLISIGL